MAKNEKKGAAPAANGTSNKDLDGFTETGIADMEAGFWDPEESPVIAGKLLGAYDMPDQFNKGGRRDYVQLKVLVPVIATKNKEPYTVERGETVSVGISVGLKPILTEFVPLVRAGANVQIKITADGKGKTKDGSRTFWKMKVGNKIISGPTGPVVPFIHRNDVAAGDSASPGRAAGGTPPGSDDDIPF